jgi:hypothetical protein
VHGQLTVPLAGDGVGSCHGSGGPACRASADTDQIAFSGRLYTLPPAPFGQRRDRWPGARRGAGPRPDTRLSPGSATRARCCHPEAAVGLAARRRASPPGRLTASLAPARGPYRRKTPLFTLSVWASTGIVTGRLSCCYAGGEVTVISRSTHRHTDQYTHWNTCRGRARSRHARAAHDLGPLISLGLPGARSPRAYQVTPTRLSPSVSR